MADMDMHDVDEEFIEYDESVDIQLGVDRFNEVWSNFLIYARNIEDRSNDYVARIAHDKVPDSAMEKVMGMADWVQRTKGSYESKLFELEAMLDHLSDSTQEVHGYLGYNTKLHPDVSIMNWKSGKHTAIELKQVESMNPNQVHPNLYDAIDQLLKRVNFNADTQYTAWKAYIYVNPGNSWPFPTQDAKKGYDHNQFVEQVKNRKALQVKSSHWTKWTTARPKATLTVVIKHGDYGRYDYVLGG